jgi:hypothetical protein
MKKIALFLYSLSSLVILFSCEKNHYKELAGDNTLAGHAFIVDTLNNVPPAAIVNQKIYLNTGSDTSSYIFQTITDSVGAFSIPSLQDDKPYIVFTRFIKVGVEYTGAARVVGGAINHTITVTLNVYRSSGNGLSILFTDGSGGPLGNFHFRLYTSRTMAVNDSARYAFNDTVTSAAGMYTRYNIPAAKYYIVGRQISGLDTLNIFDSVTVQAAGVAKKTVVGKPISTYYNGLNLVFKDPRGGVFPLLPFRIYNSQLFAVYDSVKYAFLTGTSSTSGTYERYNITPGFYYIVAKQVIGTDTIRIFSTFTVNATGITITDIPAIIAPQVINGMDVLFTDINGGPIGSLPFRIYTSSVMAFSDSTSFAYLNTNASINGTYSRRNLEPAKYYFIAKQVVGGNTLRLIDSLIVQPGLITKDTMVLK